ncbi:protein-methionine-sulfoxide reductase heme-binding subunit MsrQ [Jhaorihella thermophila]|uniref:Protein-methionine-sulfoxide reductase heme-binding subunit MsrQ n=1 Tax=Jhaorihella thermophila TaxID=488547 RepID=A0A1H5VES2_9RHOB|nr:protein-methionine-sulfoxide reductase heme-binding subunit MsrQ [Jhaorihella thermophila]SEF85852.1 sulfoxide reductase heme-binding subunit YedZ [Jhaorihella thermophila]
MVVVWINDRLRRIPIWAVYLCGGLYAPYLFWQGATGGLGVEPIRELERALGLFALKLLVAGLAISPARRLAGVNLLRFRRAVGLLAFGYVCVHLLVWLVLDVQSLPLIWADIVKRPYVTIGMAAFVLLIPLAATSNDRSLRRLGPVRWRRLHRLVYPAVLLAGLHYATLVKGLPIQPIAWLAAISFLLMLRLRPFGRPSRV